MDWQFALRILADNAASADGRKGLSFSDFQQGLREYNSGNSSDHSHAWPIFGAVLLLVVIAIVLQQRFKHRKDEPLNDEVKLTRELMHRLRLPMGSGLLLKWMATSSGIPHAVLLISPSSFDRALTAWQNDARFAPARAWCLPRLQSVRLTVFGVKNSSSV